MIAFIIGLIVGGIVMTVVMACFARSGKHADCEACEYRNWYFTHTCNKVK